ncbi:hypothetical protein N7539_006335 [Penicillium diatomitis]|uniref:Mtf2-like C-terminal domain-containing protein n=1 Tax=Penicillium diatomitis TaxID=2819901 RepID=A0A9X0BT88_9EURO|nr:uncharacterized protein N7539_006335 [Penicillium diatomitis]KAJ5482889.1 hypothetical protein N7539_006335 [Penicillium diatomitis]
MATHISRAFYLSATTSSPTPFLYQTRTLAPISLSLRRTFAARVRQYSAENRASYEYGRRGGSPRYDEEGSAYESSPHQSGSESRASSAQPRRSYLRRRSASVTSKGRSQGRSPSLHSTKSSTTVTGPERKAFGELLGQLGVGRDQVADTGDSKQSQNVPQEDQERIQELMTKFGSILKDIQLKDKSSSKAKKEQQRTYGTEGDLAFSDGDSENGDVDGEPSDEVTEPFKLRISDLGYSEPASATMMEPEITIQEAIEIVVKKESQKIEFALFQAIEEGRGDMGLWEVCKERIFSVLQHLDENANITMPGAVNKTSSDDADVADSAHTHTSSGLFRIPAVVPIDQVITELYPRTLLIAFRLLNTHFPGSPLIGQFRTTIKDQGRASALLGSSVALYDEMIQFYWYGCNDLPAVVSFLHDMDVTGLEPSSRTRRLLKDIVRQRKRDLDHGDQPTHDQDSFWDFPPNKAAYEELAGPGGWLEKLRSRARESHEQRRLRSG